MIIDPNPGSAARAHGDARHCRRLAPGPKMLFANVSLYLESKEAIEPFVCVLSH